MGDLYNTSMTSGCMLGRWAWVTSIILPVIGRLSKNVGLQFSDMSATNVADVFFVSAPVTLSSPLTACTVMDQDSAV